jgi:hypothetical protein
MLLLHPWLFNDLVYSIYRYLFQVSPASCKFFIFEPTSSRSGIYKLLYNNLDESFAVAGIPQEYSGYNTMFCYMEEEAERLFWYGIDFCQRRPVTNIAVFQ